LFTPTTNIRLTLPCCGKIFPWPVRKHISTVNCFLYFLLLTGMLPIVAGALTIVTGTLPIVMGTLPIVVGIDISRTVATLPIDEGMDSSWRPP
jgi:hypothetical protein